MEIKKENISYIGDSPIRGKIINWEKIHEYFKLLNVPKQYYQVDLPLDIANLFVVFSERDAGKTTNVLIHSLIAYVSYGVKTEWIRCKSEHIKPTNIGSMFDTIKNFNYIEIITNGKYKDIFYYRKEMFLCNREDGEKGRPKDCDDVPFIRFNSIDDMESIKSNYTSPNGDLIILDEFQAQNHAPNEFNNFFHIISTIKRERESVKIIMLGNTITPYNYYFREMDITKYIVEMKPHDKKLIRTSKGMNVFLEWFEKFSENDKYTEHQRQVDIQYFGFDGLNSIIGGAWDIKQYPHITKELDKSKIVLDEMYIIFGLFTLNLKLCYDKDFGNFVFVRPCARKYAEQTEKIVFVDRFPNKKNEIYGCGYHISKFRKFWALSKMGLFLYTTNDIGAMIDEFLNEFMK